MKMTIWGGMLATTTLVAGAVHAEETISAVHAFPESLI